MSFGISDKQVITTLEKMEGGRISQTLLVSEEEAFIKYFRGIFEELWKSGIDAIDRIKDIEDGRESDDEMADAKQYLNEVLSEVYKMKSEAIIQ